MNVHIPYRSWCRHCVAARASNSAHRGQKFAKAVEDDKVLLHARSARNGICKDPGVERPRYSHGVCSRGVVDWVIQQCARDVERLGHYGQVTLKSDQEPAFVDVLRKSRIFVGIVERCESIRRLQTHSRMGSLSAESGQLRK